MGLDQYLVSEDSIGQSEEIGYWRKHANLQGFLENKYAEQGGIELRIIELTEEMIVEIIECSKKKSFGEFDGTTGFFYGVTQEQHHSETIEFMELALKHIEKGNKIKYIASW